MFLWLILISEMLTVIHPTTRTNGLGFLHFSGQKQTDCRFPSRLVCQPIFEPRQLANEPYRIRTVCPLTVSVPEPITQQFRSRNRPSAQCLSAKTTRNFRENVSEPPQDEQNPRDVEVTHSVPACLRRVQRTNSSTLSQQPLRGKTARKEVPNDAGKGIKVRVSSYLLSLYAAPPLSIPIDLSPPRRSAAPSTQLQLADSLQKSFLF